jgi:RHS repeat-associated protein
MNAIKRLFSILTGAVVSYAAAGQDMNQLDLSTRWAGSAPSNTTVSSVSQWLQNPTEVNLAIGVTNLYADTNAYLEIDIGTRKLTFYGAGLDSLGNYIPTNYAPAGVDASLRRVYSMNMVCPNSGPNGSPLMQLADISNPNGFGATLSSSGSPSAVSSYLWSLFSSAAQTAITTDNPSTDPSYLISQTNIVQQLNAIITAGSIYNSTRFSGVTLGSDTTTLLAQNPTGQQLVLLNRMLLRDAYGLPMPNSPDFSGTAQIVYIVTPPPQFVINPYKPASSYSVQINGPNVTSIGTNVAISLQNPGSGNLSTNYSSIEIVQSKFAHYGVGDGCDDPTIPPGTAKWLRMGPGCTADTNQISLQWRASLGRTFDGLAAGDLAIYQTELSSDSYTPYAIFYNGSMTNLYTQITLGSPGNPFVWTNIYTSVILVTTNVFSVETNAAGEVYTNTDALLRQVKSYQDFVDIIALDTNNTVLKFYLASQVGTNEDQNGLYTNITGSPFVTWTIQNPNPGSATSLNIIESRSGVNTTQSLVEATSPGGVTWTLTQGSGTATRVETRQVTFAGLPTTNRIELDTVSYSGSSRPAYQCKETYNFYPWGSELVETRVPNSPGDYVTSYAYYSATDGSDPDDPSGYGYGQLKSIVYPDGYWELRLYWAGLFGTIWPVPLQICHPYIDASTGGITTLGSGPPDETKCSVTTWSNGTGSWGAGDPGQWPELKDTGDLYTYYDEVLVDGDESGTGVLDDGAIPLGAEGDLRGSWNGKADGGGSDPPPNMEYDYADDAPIGLAGHKFWIDNISTKRVNQFLYYDNGTFDPTGNAFTLNTTNQFYTSTGITNGYADFRQTTLEAEGLSEYPDPGTMWGANDGLDAYDGEDAPMLEGHVWNIDNVLQVGATKKHARIYQKGNLAQTEEYIYTGSSDGETGLILTDGAGSQWAMLNKVRYYCDSLGRPTNIVRIDPISSQTRTLYTADYRGGSGQDGELLLSETDENGKKTSYSYDSLQRIVSITVTGYGSQPNQTTSLVYDANGNMLSQTTTAGSLSQSQSAAYDLVGRVTNQVDSSGITTLISYSADNQTQTNIFPGGITIVHQQYVDEQPESVTGNGCIQQFYTHTTDMFENPGSPTAGFLDRGQEFGIAGRAQFTYLGHANSPRWMATAPDFYGHANAWAEKPVGAFTTNVIWSVTNYAIDDAQSAFEVDTSIGYPKTTFEYSFYDQPSFTSFQVSGLQTRENWSEQRYTQISGSWYKATTNWVYLTDGSEVPTVSSIELDQVNGFTGSESASMIDYDADTNETISTSTIDRSQDKVTVTTSEPNTSSLTATEISQNNLLISCSSLSVSSPTLYYYDALGRTNQIQDSLGFSSYITYDPNTGRTTSMTDPAGNTTLLTYYNTNEANAGKLKYQTDPNGKNTYFAYTTEGQLYRTWGDVPYPAEYRYNEYGDLTNLITFRGGSGWNSSTWPSSPGTGDNTYWVYDEASGALLKKIDAQRNAVSYTYDSNTGQPITRSWARTIGGVNVTVTNYYDGFDDITEEVYNDGTTNVLYNNFNRVGQPREIVDASGTNELTYDYASRLISSVCTNGLLAGITVSNHFNPYYGPDSVSVLGLSSSLQDNYSYDSYGRLGSVSSGTYSATYSYVPNSDLLQSTIFQNSSTTVLTTTRTWQYGYRLGSIANVANGATVASDTYAYDSVNRRTQTQLEDGSVWNYGYNDRNEVTGANRHWNDETAVSGQQYGYAYDNVGNRQSATFGGDINGLNLQTISYSANNLNQYTSITTPGEKDIEGVAYTINNVTVNNGLADRKWQYFHRQIGIANTNQPVWQSVTNISGAFTNRGGLVFPANNQTLVYDADGNLSFDGIWNYQWDGENRLISMAMTNVSGIANSNRLELQFGYDSGGRRISKVVSAWNGATFVSQSTNYFLYDGGNLIAVINPGLSLGQSFVWGNDLSGTMTDVGDIGGLAMATFGNTTCFPAYDAGGNITALVNANDESIAAKYEYSPFAELIRATGLFAKQNPFRFSTMFWDDESGLIFYPNRYYSPALGKWISRDQGEDPTSPNLYLYVLNNVNDGIDPDGQSWKGLLRGARIFVVWAQIVKAAAGHPSNSQVFNEVTRLKQNVKEAERAGHLLKVTKGISGPGGDDPESEFYLHKGAFLVLAFGVTIAQAEAEAELGSIFHATGVDSSSPIVQMYGDLDNNEQGYADLDAIDAALDATGGTDESTLLALGVFYQAQNAWEGDSDNNSPAPPVESYEEISIKQ